MKTKKPNPVEVAAAVAGSQANLARALRVTEPSICKWIKLGYVPIERAKQIESLYAIPRTQLISPKVLRLVDSLTA